MKTKKVYLKKDIDVLFEIINNKNDYKENSENGLVILLNGSWGSGKTTFLAELEEYINNNDNYELFVEYNSFNYDFYENAYLPFFAIIENKVKLNDSFGKLIRCTSKNFINTTVSVSYSITKSLLQKKIGVDINDIKDNLIGMQNEEYFKNFNDFVDCKKKIKKKLEKYCEKKTQIFIIDELDRCKPNFAIETLEIVKHFFDINNCIFIIAVDKIQLQESAKTIFGQGLDIEKYFSKFFDYQYNLLPLSFNEIVDISEIEELNEIVNRSTTIFNCLKISSRDSKKIFTEFVNKYKKYNNDNNDNDVWTTDQSEVILFFLTLKYVDLLFYTELMNGNYNRFKDKITDDFNPIANNYLKLLSIVIGDQKSFDYLCSRLTHSLNTVFIDLSELNTIKLPNDNEYEKRRAISKELSSYIPQVGHDLTFKQTILQIIN